VNCRWSGRLEISATPLWDDMCCTVGAPDVQAATMTQTVTVA
jgi:hypothetical protein